jgi:hypothetical protein
MISDPQWQAHRLCVPKIRFCNIGGEIRGAPRLPTAGAVRTLNILADAGLTSTQKNILVRLALHAFRQAAKAGRCRETMTTLARKNRIMVFGPKSDGTYLVEFRTAFAQSIDSRK